MGSLLLSDRQSEQPKSSYALEGRVHWLGCDQVRTTEPIVPPQMLPFSFFYCMLVFSNIWFIADLLLIGEKCREVMHVAFFFLFYSRQDLEIRRQRSPN